MGSAKNPYGNAARQPPRHGYCGHSFAPCRWGAQLRTMFSTSAVAPGSQDFTGHRTIKMGIHHENSGLHNKPWKIMEYGGLS